MSSMTGREELCEEKPKVKMLSPGFGIDKSRLHGSGFRSKGFAITDLLGLESDLQVRQQPGGPAGSGLSAAGSGPGSEPQGVGGGLGGFSFPGGSLPLGLGFLCSLAAQQPAGAPCFLPGHLPLLQARADSHYMQNLEAQRDAYSGTARVHEPFYCSGGFWFRSGALTSETGSSFCGEQVPSGFYLAFMFNLDLVSQVRLSSALLGFQIQLRFCETGASGFCFLKSFPFRLIY